MYDDAICFVKICECGCLVVVFRSPGKPTGEQLMHMVDVLVEQGVKFNRRGKVDKDRQCFDRFHLHLI